MHSAQMESASDSSGFFIHRLCFYSLSSSNMMTLNTCYSDNFTFAAFVNENKILFDGERMDHFG